MRSAKVEEYKSLWKGYLVGAIVLTLGIVWNCLTSADNPLYVLKCCSYDFITYTNSNTHLETNVASWYIIGIGLCILLFNALRTMFSENEE